MFNYSKIQSASQSKLNSKVKIDLALKNASVTNTSHDNGDEEKYEKSMVAPYAGSFHKLLPHDSNGQISKDSYELLLKAIHSGKQHDFDQLSLFDNSLNQLADPQASLNYCLMGIDNSSVQSLTPPGINTPHAAVEMIENYCKELCRDIPFSNWQNDSTISKVIGYMNQTDVLNAYHGPTSNGQVTLQNLFRGNNHGYEDGPYISQLLYQDFPYGALLIEQKYKVPKEKSQSSVPVDFGVSKSSMIAIQNGIEDESSPERFQENTKYLYNGRALAEAVHNDPLYQFYYNAALILLKLGCPCDDGFKGGINEKTFTSNGGPVDILHHVANISGLALKHAWFHKWQVHRRIRPEAFSLLVHNQKENVTGFNYINHLLINHPILDDIRQLHIDYYNESSYTLSSVFPEGSPTHPAYPAGHAVVAGACATILKIFFQADLSWEQFATVVEANNDGTQLVNYNGDVSNMTINSEINKLASNISLGRDWANVHYRSDGDWGNLIGEELAIHYMKDVLNTYNQTYNGEMPILTLEKFDGSIIKIKANIIP